MTISAPITPLRHPGWVLNRWFVNGVEYAGSDALNQVTVDGAITSVVLEYVREFNRFRFGGGQGNGGVRQAPASE